MGIRWLGKHVHSTAQGLVQSMQCACCGSSNQCEVDGMI